MNQFTVFNAVPTETTPLFIPPFGSETASINLEVMRDTAEILGVFNARLYATPVSSCTTMLEEEYEEFNNIKVRQSWLHFSLSLFPNSRLFTKEEQEQFKSHQKKTFKRFRFDF